MILSFNPSFSRLSLPHYRYVTVTVMTTITVTVWSEMTVMLPNIETFTPHYRYRYVTVTVITVTVTVSYAVMTAIMTAFTSMHHSNTGTVSTQRAHSQHTVSTQ